MLSKLPPPLNQCLYEAQWYMSVASAIEED